jgi:FkbM family methyltransferase
MIERLLNLYALLFARPIFRNLNYLLIQMGLRGIGVLNYRTSYLSGEDLVIRKIVNTLDKKDGIVLDVGANEGDFTDLILSESENLRVLSFEPHPKTYSRLRQRFVDKSPRVEILNCAVGDETGEISLFDYDDLGGSQHASVFKDAIEGSRGGKAKEHRVKLITLDSLNIQGDVRLVKVDVEGFELPVLRGAKRLINDKRPKFVVIEFNEMNVNSRTFLRDIAKELSGYRIDRILPGGHTLELYNPYRAWNHEIFAYQNLLFTRS